MDKMYTILIFFILNSTFIRISLIVQTFLKVGLYNNQIHTSFNVTPPNFQLVQPLWLQQPTHVG